MLIDFYAMTSVIVDYTFKNVFLTFYIRQAGPLKRHKACDNLSPYSPSRRAGCVNLRVN